MSLFVLRYKEKGKSQAIELSRQMYPKKDEDDEEDDEEEDDEEEQSEKALAAYNSGQVKKKCFRCGHHHC